MTNRQLAALETRKKLLDTAKQLICDKGLTNTSVAEITKACGVSSGTFYTYFKRKEDVVFELSRTAFQDILESAQSYQGAFLQRLTFFMVNFSSYIEKSSLKLCQDWVRNTVDPDLVENETDRNKLALDIHSAQQLLERGVAQGELRPDTPISVLAHTLMDILYGQMLCWDMSGGVYSFAQRTQEFCNTFLPSIITPYLTGEDS